MNRQARLGESASFDASAPQLGEAASVPELGLDDEAVAAGALPGQRSLIFRDREAMERFLKRAGERIGFIFWCLEGLPSGMMCSKLCADGGV